MIPKPEPCPYCAGAVTLTSRETTVRNHIHSISMWQRDCHVCVDEPGVRPPNLPSNPSLKIVPSAPTPTLLD
jgi:hypothetical protein